MRPVNLELYIEELVLHGIPPGDRHRLSEAFQRELVRLISEKGVPPSVAKGSDIGFIDGGTFKSQQGAKPETIGMQVARTVYRGLSK